jgi:hypothetical protein
MKNVLVGVALSVLAVNSLTGCGSSSGPKRLSIQLTPATQTLAVNSSVAINAQTTPSLPKYHGSMLWSIQDYQSSTECTEYVLDPQSAPPMPGCAKGWFAMENPFTGYTPTGGYYYSPALPGNYTVLVQGQITDQSFPPKIIYEGSASAAVTVTAQ